MKFSFEKYFNLYKINIILNAFQFFFLNGVVMVVLNCNNILVSITLMTTEIINSVCCFFEKLKSILFTS